MKICVVGTGYVGLVTGACLAHKGHFVTCVDSDPKKIESLEKGKIPIYEPGLESIVKNCDGKTLFFSTSLASAIKDAEVAFIAVGTPPQKNGDADLSYVEQAAKQIADLADHSLVVVQKSTVPPKTGYRLQELFKAHPNHSNLSLASNPEFLREGTAVSDFLNPDRIVIGTGSKAAQEKMHDVYSVFSAPIIFTDIPSAELIKYASNAFLALKISYANFLAEYCERIGANIDDVVLGMGSDPRIGNRFLNAGIGYGGSCFPKDVSAFVSITKEAGLNPVLLSETEAINKRQRKRFAEKIKSFFKDLNGKTIGVLGLAFKPETDDLREAPSLDIIPFLLSQGAKVKVFDPVAMDNAKPVLSKAVFCSNTDEAVSGCDALVLLTEWNEFKKMDLKKIKSLLKQPVFFDGRNVFKPSEMNKAGFTYISMGRKVE